MQEISHTRSLLNIPTGGNEGYDYFDKLRESNNAEPLTSEVVRVNVTQVTNGEEEVSSILLRHIASFIDLGHSLESAYGVLLALHHFNTGNDVATPEIATVRYDGCNIRFTADIFNTEGSQLQSYKILLNSVLPRKNNAILNASQPYASAVVGAVLSRVSMPLAILTGLNKLTQVSGSSGSTALNNKAQHPYFARTIADVKGEAYAAVEYLYSLNVQHFGILFVQDDYGVAYSQALQDAASVKGMDTILATIPLRRQDDGYKEIVRVAVRKLYESFYNYYYLVIFKGDMFDDVLDVSFEMKLVGPETGNVFFFSGQALIDIQSKQYLPQSNLTKALHGSGIFMPYASNKVVEQFSSELSENNGVANAYIKTKLPEAFRQNTSMSYNTASKFQISIVSHFYDAAMALALASCEAQKLKGDYFSSLDLWDALLESNFTGASGKVKFDSLTGTRLDETVSYSLYNIIDTGEIDTNGHAIFKERHLQIYEKVWKPVGDEIFIYSNGGEAPPSLPEIFIQNKTISLWAQIYGFVLCALSVAMSLGFLAWTSYYKKTSVVKASQPIFLGMLCVGTLFIGLSIFTVGVQEPLSQGVLDGACISFPWLLAIGFVVSVSALFSKTRRINKILVPSRRFQRTLLRPKDVIGPFLCLLALNLIILIIWTILSPLKYRWIFSDASKDMFDRPTVRSATCFPSRFRFELKDGILVWTLIAIDFGALMYALFEAYRGRTISTTFSESRYIFIATASIFEAVIIGLPVVIAVVDQEPTTLYVVGASLLFIICMSILLPIFIPKIKFLQEKKTINVAASVNASVRSSARN